MRTIISLFEESTKLFPENIYVYQKEERPDDLAAALEDVIKLIVDKIDLFEQTYRETFPDERMVSATSVVPTMQKRLKDYQESYESFSVLSESAISSLEILREISSRIPREIKVQVTDLSISQDEVEMEGLIDNPGDADKIKLKLAESNYFSSVDVPSTTQEDHKYKFKIAAIVKKT